MADKLALCVGVNYPGTAYELAGCVNDANDWAELLGREGYSVALLLDSGATKAAITAALRLAVEGLSWGDRLVFTFSGHGTWVPDNDGDEADTRDEAICPVDFAGGNLVTDDELHSVLSARATGSGALVLSDSCHSGTVARLVAPATAGVPRFVSPAEFSWMTPEQARTAESLTSPAPPRPSASLISGCGDLEYSFDAWFGSRANGAFTRAAIDTYASGASLAAWHRNIRTLLPSGSYPQTPQLAASSLYRRYSRAV